MKPTPRQTAEVNAGIARTQDLKLAAAICRKKYKTPQSVIGIRLYDLTMLERELLLQSDEAGDDARCTGLERLAHDVRQLAERLRKFGSAGS